MTEYYDDTFCHDTLCYMTVDLNIFWNVSEIQSNEYSYIYKIYLLISIQYQQ
jgi:hypothetical protein